MEAKETVMSLDAFNLWSSAWHVENDVPELYMKADFLSRWELAKLEHQAEISFKAGIKEVAEWIETVAGRDKFTATNGEHYGMLTILDETWQAKLKSWNISD